MVPNGLPVRPKLGRVLVALAFVLRLICIGCSLGVLTGNDYFYIKSVYTPPNPSSANITITTEYFDRDLKIRGSHCTLGPSGASSCYGITSNIIPLDYQIGFFDDPSFEFPLYPSIMFVALSGIASLIGVCRSSQQIDRAHATAMGFTFVFSFIHFIPSTIALALYPSGAYNILKDAIKFAYIPNTVVTLHRDKVFTFLVVNVVSALLSIICVYFSMRILHPNVPCCDLSAGRRSRSNFFFDALRTHPATSQQINGAMQAAFAANFPQYGPQGVQMGVPVALSAYDRPQGVPMNVPPGSMTGAVQSVPYPPAPYYTTAGEYQAGQVYQPVPLPSIQPAQYGATPVPMNNVEMGVQPIGSLAPLSLYGSPTQASPSAPSAPYPANSDKPTKSV